MSSTTSKGFPFPTGTDRLMDGDNAIQALAAKVDNSVGLHAAGVLGMAFNNDFQVSQIITFPAGRFTAAPNVVSVANNGTYITAVTGITTTQFNLWCRQRTDNLATLNVTVQWIATQV